MSVEMETIITVDGMTCGHCESTVEDALHEVPGVTDARVDREAGVAHVDGDAQVSTLVHAVEAAGYTVRA